MYDACSGQGHDLCYLNPGDTLTVKIPHQIAGGIPDG